MTKSTKQSKIMKKSYSLEIVKPSKINIKFKVRENKVFEVSNRPYASNVKATEETNVEYKFEIDLYYSIVLHQLVLIETKGLKNTDLRVCKYLNDLFTTYQKITCDINELKKLGLIRISCSNWNTYLDKGVYGSWKAVNSEIQIYPSTKIICSSKMTDSTNLSIKNYQYSI